MVSQYMHSPMDKNGSCVENLEISQQGTWKRIVIQKGESLKVEAFIYIQIGQGI